MSIIPDPGPLPDGATPKEREAHRRAKERFDMEGGRPGVAAYKPGDLAANDKRLRMLRLEHNRFLDLHSPMKASLWLALLRPAKDVIHDAEMSRRYRESQRLGIEGAAHIAPDRPAIIEIGQQLVAAALAGDVTAIDRISDRIEGKAGLRVGDEDEGDPAKRRQATDITERVIARLTQQRIADITPTVSKTIDVTAVEVETKK